MTSKNAKGGWLRYWPRLLLAIPFIVVLWVPSYNSIEPSLGGIPFFYWYQLAWILGGALLAAGQTSVAWLAFSLFVIGLGWNYCFVAGSTMLTRHLHPEVKVRFQGATDLLVWLPAASLARFDLLYPDPWPKRRHWKRRFVQDTSVAAIAASVRQGGEFRFASDIPDYAAWTLRRVLRSPERWERIVEVAARFDERLPGEPDAAALAPFPARRRL